MGVVAELVPEEQLSDYELERGKPIPSKNHGLVQAFLIMALSKYIDKYNILCEVALDLDPSLTPDITIYPKFVMDWIHDEIRMSELPLVAIEILSPKQYVSEVIEKIETYFEAGVPSCWVVQPLLKTIAVFTPDMQSRV